ncbi:MAG: hypothetical protein MUC68_18280 [Burkholderiaceae bacterium]|jgi:hypothetical protein|nr:hypothetical protein [Burkholderiaceae bacterium]
MARIDIGATHASTRSLVTRSRGRRGARPHLLVRRQVTLDHAGSGWRPRLASRAPRVGFMAAGRPIA